MMQEMKLSIHRSDKIPVAFKNCAPFSKCSAKTDGTTRDDSEDLGLVILMCSLIKQFKLF